PTLENVRIESAGGWFQLGFSGRLDLEGYLPGDEPAWIIPTTEPFVAPRLRVFADAFFGERVVTSAELRVDRGEEPAAQAMEVRIDQLFARFSIVPQLALQAGKFVSPLGGYSSRHHSVADPLVRPPLLYDYRTVMCPGIAPLSTSGLMTWKDRPDEFRDKGAPVIWGAPYQWGAMALGSVGPLEYRVAAMNSAPSSEPEEWGLDRGFDALSYIGSVGLQVVPQLRVRVSYSTGPWLQDVVRNLEAGRSSYYDQRLWGAEATLHAGRTTLRGEVFHDTWEVPNTDYDPVDVSWYVEAERDVKAGVTLAARYGAIHFSELGGATQYGEPWDYDVNRLQLGAGYRLARNLGARVEAALNGTNGPHDPSDNLFSAQLWWTF
ncbi:MAG TPA: hypothetical protein VK928_12955, partial [Longimicrobiales bacterium]|nr:hypothetical protein [Longimicrobiales bacterium]